MNALGPHQLNCFDEEIDACLIPYTSLGFHRNTAGMKNGMQARVARVHHSGVLGIHDCDAAVLTLPRHWQRVSGVIRTRYFLQKCQEVGCIQMGYP
jgi:hypothetical protein